MVQGRNISTHRRVVLHRLITTRGRYHMYSSVESASNAIQCPIAQSWQFMYGCNVLRLKAASSSNTFRSTEGLRICMRVFSRGSFVNQGPDHIPICYCTVWYGVFLKLHGCSIVGVGKEMRMMQPIPSLVLCTQSLQKAPRF